MLGLLWGCKKEKIEPVLSEQKKSDTSKVIIEYPKVSNPKKIEILDSVSKTTLLIDYFPDGLVRTIKRNIEGQNENYEYIKSINYESGKVKSIITEAIGANVNSKNPIKILETYNYNSDSISKYSRITYFVDKIDPDTLIYSFNENYILLNSYDTISIIPWWDSHPEDIEFYRLVNSSKTKNSNIKGLVFHKLNLYTLNGWTSYGFDSTNYTTTKYNNKDAIPFQTIIGQSIEYYSNKYNTLIDIPWFKLDILFSYLPSRVDYTVRFDGDDSNYIVSLSNYLFETELDVLKRPKKTLIIKMEDPDYFKHPLSNSIAHQKVVYPVTEIRYYY